MTAGRTLFWLSTLFASLAVLWVLSDLLYGINNNHPPILDVTGAVLAATIWAVGWLCWFAF